MMSNGSAGPHGAILQYNNIQFSALDGEKIKVSVKLSTGAVATTFIDPQDGTVTGLQNYGAPASIPPATGG
jgi:hypothetical protein